MTQTSNTESVAISHLKHLNGNPLGTSMPLVGPWEVWEALVTACPNDLSITRPKRPVVSLMMLLSESTI